MMMIMLRCLKRHCKEGGDTYRSLCLYKLFPTVSATDNSVRLMQHRPLCLCKRFTPLDSYIIKWLHSCSCPTTASFDPVTRCSYEDSEVMLYRVRLLEESGLIQAALTYLTRHAAVLSDRRLVLTKQADFHRTLGEVDTAMTLYERLLDENCDDYHTHWAMQACLLSSNSDSNSDSTSSTSLSRDASQLLLSRPLTASQEVTLMAFYDRRREASPMEDVY